MIDSYLPWFGLSPKVSFTEYSKLSETLKRPGTILHAKLPLVCLTTPNPMMNTELAIYVPEKIERVKRKKLDTWCTKSSSTSYQLVLIHF